MGTRDYLYLQTESESNVEMYEHYDFRVVREIALQSLGLPMWEMVREPHPPIVTG